MRFDQSFYDMVTEFENLGFSYEEAFDKALEAVRDINIDPVLDEDFATGGRVGLDKGGITQLAMSDPDPMDEKFTMLENLADRFFNKPLNKLSDDEVMQFAEEEYAKYIQKEVTQEVSAWMKSVFS